MDLIVSHPKCLVILFKRLIEIIHGWYFVIWITTIIDVRVDQGCESVFRYQCLLRSVNCTQNLWPRYLLWLCSVLSVAILLVLISSVSFVQLIINHP